MGFVHLHNHSEYSILEGTASVKDLVRRAAELGMPAVALTDRGTGAFCGLMGGVMELDRACKDVSRETERPIKPIFGCEVCFTDTVGEDGHIRHDVRKREYSIVLLAKNDEGYRNLVKLVSEVNTGEMPWGYATLPLLEKYGGGLICLSGFKGGIIPKLLYLGKDEEAFSWAQRLAACFAPGDFYIEVQNHGRSIYDGSITEQELDRRLAGLARRGGWKLVATNDVHYLDSEDAETYLLLTCLKQGRTVDDPSLRQHNPGGEYCFKSEAEMRACMGPEFAEACDNTVEIAEKCKVTLPRGCGYPRFPLPPGEDADSRLRELCEKALTRLVGPRSPETQAYWDRYEEEVETIIFFEGEDYFLIMQELVNWARSQGICVGPGRGSAGDCLVNWLLGITEIDPSAHGLVFERFLRLDNPTCPDIDIDFESGRRDEVVQHLKDLYGEDHVGGISVYARIWARAAIRDAAQVLGYPAEKVDLIFGMLDDRSPLRLDDELWGGSELGRAYENDDDVRRIVDAARKLEGRIKSRGVHACGIVLNSVPLSDHVPLVGGVYPNKGLIVQFDAPSVEDACLMKLDLLPMKVLDTISAACKLINERHGTHLAPDDIPVDDAQALALLSNGKAAGLFMADNPRYSQFFEKLPSVRFEDVVASFALAERPGPLEFGMTNEYLDIRRGAKPARQYDPRLESILAETGGMLVYQEQLMRVAMEMCGFPDGVANRLRKAMAKMRKDILTGLKEKWDAGAAANGFAASDAEAIWNEALRHGACLFNKAHAVGYAMLVMRTAYLKAHWPAEYLVAALNTHEDEQNRLLEACKKEGISVLRPDINRSGIGFTAEDGGIRCGLSGIVGAGNAGLMKMMAGNIVRVRDAGGPFTSLADFKDRLRKSTPHGFTGLEREAIDAIIVRGLIGSVGEPDAGPCDETRRAREAEMRSQIAYGYRWSSRRWEQMGLLDEEKGEEEM